MSGIHERSIQAVHIRSLQDNAALFKTICNVLALMIFTGSAFGVFIAIASDEIWFTLLAVPVVLQGIALICFARMMSSLSIVTATTFEMAMELKQSRIKAEEG